MISETAEQFANLIEGNETAIILNDTNIGDVNNTVLDSIDVISERTDSLFNYQIEELKARRLSVGIDRDTRSISKDMDGCGD